MRKIMPIPEFALQSLGLAFGLVGEMSQQLYIRALEPLGVNEQQFFVLTALHNLGPQVQAHLSAPLQIDKATMVGLINDLEQKGYVERQPHPKDRRAVLVHLTEAGQELLQQGYVLSNQFVAQFFAGVTTEEQAQLLALLKRLAANAQTLAEQYAEKERA